MGLIYKRTSPSGKYYIGKSVTSEEKRWKRHVKEALDKNSDTYNTLLSYAIRKYGEENFQLEILEDNIPNEILVEKEQYYINKYNAYYLDFPYNGYNMTRGGDGGLKYSDEEILNAWNKGLNVSEIAKAIGARRHTITHRLDALKINAADRHDRGINITKQKTRLPFEIQSKIIQRYLELENIDKVAKEFKLSSATIAKYLKINNIDAKQKDIKRRTKRVYQIDKDNNIILNIFDSAREAAEKLFPEKVDAAKRSINEVACIKNNRQTAYGYKWIYEENYKGEKI